MTLTQLQQKNTRKPFHSIRRRLDLRGAPQRKGVCVKVYTMSPRKPNSAVRKVCRVHINGNKKKVTVYIPGETHTLQKHGVILMRGGRAKDVPGVRYKAIRGKYDLQRLSGRRKQRSIFGARMPEDYPHRAPYRSSHLWW